MRTSTVVPEISLAPARLVALDHRPRKLARAVNLLYVSDEKSGIARKRSGKSWSYSKADRPIRDSNTLLRIRALSIPPAWTDVWICGHPNGHLQATGRDEKGRKQYRYHKLWEKARGDVKYHRLEAFGKHLPAMRKQVVSDLRRHGIPKEKVLAAMVALMERTRIRIGNKAYEHENGSFGLSTLKDKHVIKEKSGIRLRFKGKSGIVHDIPLHSAKLARLVMRCKELPGQELFQYLDDDGNVHNVDSDMVNEYVRTTSGGDFSSKDLRTWTGSARCVEALLEQERPVTQSACAVCINAAMDEVASHLGNTRAVCKAHYVHPGVVTAFEKDELSGLGKGVRERKSATGLSRSERVLMKICARKARP